MSGYILKYFSRGFIPESWLDFKLGVDSIQQSFTEIRFLVILDHSYVDLNKKMP